MDEKEVNVIYVPQEIQDAINHGLTDGYEFNAEQIKFEECLGKGAFGFVHRARALGITAEPEWTLVAVKTLSGKGYIASFSLSVYTKLYPYRLYKFRGF